MELKGNLSIKISEERDLTLYKLDEKEFLTDEVVSTHEETLEKLKKAIKSQIEDFLADFFYEYIFDALEISDDHPFIDPKKVTSKIEIL